MGRALAESFCGTFQLLLKKTELAFDLTVYLDFMFNDLRGIECRGMIPIYGFADIF